MPQFIALPDMHLWSQSIGGLIINFGILEFQSFRWIQVLGGESAVARAKNWTLSHRIDTALALLESSHIPDKDQNLARELWSEVKVLSKMRNRIAHNPLCQGTDQVSKQLIFSVVELKRMTPNGENILEPLSYQAIAATAIRVRDLNQQLSTILESTSKERTDSQLL